MWHSAARLSAYREELIEQGEQDLELVRRALCV